MLTLLLAACSVFGGRDDDDEDDDTGSGSGDPFGDADTDTDSDGDGDSDGDSDTDTDTDTDTDSDTDSNPTWDADGDGFESDDDCDDSDPRVNPDASENCRNGIDDDCDGDEDADDSDCETTDDKDGDGFDDERAGGDDCDDRDADINPDAEEDCNDGTDNDCDGDEDRRDSECSSGGDTGIAYLYYLAEGGTSGSSWSGGSFGFGWYGLAAGDWVCTLTGDWDDTGAKPTSGCPDCEWEFALEVTGTIADGTDCDDFADLYGFDETLVDDSSAWWHGTWGFTYELDYFGDGSLILEETLLLEYGGDWYAIFTNAPTYGIYQVYGDATSFTAYRAASTDTGIASYYYYP